MASSYFLIKYKETDPYLSIKNFDLYLQIEIQQK